MRSWIGRSLALVVLGSACALLAGATAAPQEMIRDGGFENGDTAGIGRNWASESYGSATIHFDLSTDKVQLGKLAAANVPIVVQKTDENSYGAGVDGLLGMSFLSRFEVQMTNGFVEVRTRRRK